jgi:hypothetical protein
MRGDRAIRFIVFGWFVFWVGWLVSSVHSLMPLRSEPVEFGWGPCLLGVAIVVGSGFVGYMYGIEKRSDG